MYSAPFEDIVFVLRTIGPLDVFEKRLEFTINAFVELSSFNLPDVPDTLVGLANPAVSGTELTSAESRA